MHLSAPASALTALLNLDAEPNQPGLRYTPQEILRQPEAWQKTYDVFEARREELLAFVSPRLQANVTVVLVGAGTSDYVGWCVAPLLRQRWQCEVLVVPSTEMLTNDDDTLLSGGEYLFISFSRSGGSPEGVAVLLRLFQRRPDAHHLIVTCNAAGAMAQLAQSNKRALSIILPHANDEGLAMTSSFSSMVVLGQALAHIHDDVYPKRLVEIKEAGRQLLAAAPPVASDLAGKGYPSVCFVGSGTLAATARECALKSLELTAGGVRALWESTLGLRHGPLSALSKETLFVAFVSGDPRRRAYDEDLLREIRANGIASSIVAIGPLSDHTVADIVLNSPAHDSLPDTYRPPVDVIFGQLYGLFSSVYRHLPPDTPSPTGVISRVVRPFPIH